MPKVRFMLGKQSFDLACEEGQEPRITELALRLNERFMRLAKNFQSAPDSMVLAVTALMMEDEIETARKNAQARAEAQEQAEKLQERQWQEVERLVRDVVDPVANHIEMLAEKIENL